MTLTRPSLEQLIWICRNIAADQKPQWVVLSGSDYNPELLAWNLYNRSGLAHVFVAEEMPYMACGFTPLNPKVVESWSVNTDERKGHDIEITRVCREAIQAVFKAGIERIQTRCLAESTEAQRWYHALGLKLECTQEKLGVNGESVCTYVRFKEG